MGDTIKVKKVGLGTFQITHGFDEYGPMRARETAQLVGSQLKNRPNSIVLTERYSLGPNPTGGPPYVIKTLRGDDVAGDVSASALWKAHAPDMLLNRTIMATLQQAAKLAQGAPGAAYSRALLALDGPGAAEVARIDPCLAYSLVLDKLARRKVPMSVWGEQEHYWPEPMEFELSPDRKDRIGDYYEVTYLFVGDLSLSVVMDAGPFIDSDGDKPGKYKATFHGATEAGIWKDLDDIPTVLRGLTTKAQKARRSAEDALTRVGGSKWKVTYDWDQLLAEYQNPDSDGAVMSVTFEDVEDAVFGEGDGEAVISYAAGQDYQGAYGRQEERKAYDSKAAIEQVLKAAEKLWGRWHDG